MPCAASPPSTFCQLQVTTSSCVQGSGIAKTAEVASQIVSPARPSGIANEAGIRTPELVPFHAKTRSWAKSMRARSGNSPYGASSTRASRRSSRVTSDAQVRLKVSKARTSTGRSPSSDQSAASTAPVSDAGTMARRMSSGIRSRPLLRASTSSSRSRAGGDRCERPVSAAASTSTVQPGRFTQGPEPNCERFGFVRGGAKRTFNWRLPWRWVQATMVSLPGFACRPAALRRPKTSDHAAPDSGRRSDGRSGTRSQRSDALDSRSGSRP